MHDGAFEKRKKKKEGTQTIAHLACLFGLALLGVNIIREREGEYLNMNKGK